MSLNKHTHKLYIFKCHWPSLSIYTQIRKNPWPGTSLFFTQHDWNANTADNRMRSVENLRNNNGRDPLHRRLKRWPLFPTGPLTSLLPSHTRPQTCSECMIVVNILEWGSGAGPLVAWWAALFLTFCWYQWQYVKDGRRIPGAWWETACGIMSMQTHTVVYVLHNKLWTVLSVKKKKILNEIKLFWQKWRTCQNGVLMFSLFFQKVTHREQIYPVKQIIFSP